MLNALIGVLLGTTYAALEISLFERIVPQDMTDDQWLLFACLNGLATVASTYLTEFVAIGTGSENAERAVVYSMITWSGVMIWYKNKA